MVSFISDLKAPAVGPIPLKLDSDVTLDFSLEGLKLNFATWHNELKFSHGFWTPKSGWIQVLFFFFFFRHISVSGSGPSS